MHRGVEDLHGDDGDQNPLDQFRKGRWLVVTMVGTIDLPVLPIC